MGDHSSELSTNTRFMLVWVGGGGGMSMQGGEENNFFLCVFVHKCTFVCVWCEFKCEPAAYTEQI
jgi:hypothetical protein